MAIPPIYLDECVDHRLAIRLRESGVDVLTVVEAGTLSNDDESQLQFATSQRRVLFSQNQIDFRWIHAQFRDAERSHGGIILMPQTTPFDRSAVRAHILLDWVSSFTGWTGRLFTWSELQQRLIHGYRQPHWDEQSVRAALGWQA